MSTKPTADEVLAAIKTLYAYSKAFINSDTGVSVYSDPETGFGVVCIVGDGAADMANGVLAGLYAAKHALPINIH